MSERPYPLPASDLRRVVNSALARLDVALTESGEAAVIDELQQRIRFDPASRKVIVTDRTGAPVVDIDADGRVIERSIGDHLRRLAGSSPSYFRAAESSTDDAAASTANEPNPFAAGSRNLTAQMRLLRSDPGRAAQLRAQAAEAYGADNPWRKGPHWNITSQMRISRSNPELAKRLKATAGIV